MSAKKPIQNKEEDPLETVRVNISMTRGTSEILKQVADHKHVTMSAVVTCLIRSKAEEVGLLPSTVQKDTPAKESNLKPLPSPARTRTEKAK